MARHVEFTLDNLRHLDFGVLQAAFQKELERCVDDCCDRPADETARVVQIKFLLKPDCHPGVADCDHISLECEIAGAIPKRRTKVYQMSPLKNGKLRFHPDSPDDPDADMLFDGDDEKPDGKSAGAG